MGQFTDYNFTLFINLTDIMLKERMIQTIVQITPHILSNEGDKANICILDACTYLANKAYYNSNYEVCLKIIYPDNYQSIDEILSGDIGFILRSEFTAYELENTLTLLQEYLTFKFQSQILQSIFDSAQNSLVLTDAKGVIQYANHYFLNATGFESKELLGELPKLIKSEIHQKEFYQNLWSTIESGSVWYGFFINRRKNGRLFYEEATISPIFNTLGQISNYLKIGKVVERERLLSQELNKEIKSAQDLISYMLPMDYADANICFVSKVKAFNYLGGDYVCFEKISETKYGIGIIDVMGHSASSAFIGLKAISIFQSIIHYDNLENSVKKVNEAVVRINTDDMSVIRYLSGIFIEVDITSNSISYINAGHPAFYLKRGDGFIKATSNNMILGISDSHPFVVDTIPTDQISYMFLYSDGLIESDKGRIAESELYLEKALLSAEKQENHFLDIVLDEMIGYEEIDDDITLCYLRL
jgi:PAS domain S-box-containing protein